MAYETTTPGKPVNEAGNMNTKISRGPHALQQGSVTAHDLMTNPMYGDFAAGRALAIDAAHIKAGNPALDQPIVPKYGPPK
jgi:hypothetical protein